MWHTGRERKNQAEGVAGSADHSEWQQAGEGRGDLAGQGHTLGGGGGGDAGVFQPLPDICPERTEEGESGESFPERKEANARSSAAE